MLLVIIIGVAVVVTTSAVVYDYYSFYDEYDKKRKLLADVLLTCEEVIRYSQMAPNNWFLNWGNSNNMLLKYQSHGKMYSICFTTYREWKKYKKYYKNYKVNQNKYEFLNSVKKDIESYLTTINNETAKEIEKINEFIPKTEEGKQNIDKLFEDYYNKKQI